MVALVKKSDLAQQADGSFALATSSYEVDYQLSAAANPLSTSRVGAFAPDFWSHRMLSQPPAIASKACRTWRASDSYSGFG